MVNVGRFFGKLEASSQVVLPDRSKGQKMMENAKIEKLAKVTFWVIFKQFADNLNRYIDSRLTDQGTEEYYCSICQSASRYKSSVFRHIRLKHSKEPQANCPLCRKTFANRIYMLHHFRTIHKNKAFTWLSFSFKSGSADPDKPRQSISMHTVFLLQSNKKQHKPTREKRSFWASYGLLQHLRQDFEE